MQILGPTPRPARGRHRRQPCFDAKLTVHQALESDRRVGEKVPYAQPIDRRNGPNFRRVCRLTGGLRAVRRHQVPLNERLLAHRQS